MPNSAQIIKTDGGSPAKYSLGRAVATLGQPTHPATCGQRRHKGDFALSRDKGRIGEERVGRLLTAEYQDSREEEDGGHGEADHTQRPVICASQTQSKHSHT